MFKHILVAVLAVLAMMGPALAQVDVNKATPVALEGIKGIGAATSKRIIEERKKAAFKDWSDFENRVKGIGGKKAAALSAAGLTVNGTVRPGSAPAAQKVKNTKTAAAGK